MRPFVSTVCLYRSLIRFVRRVACTLRCCLSTNRRSLVPFRSNTPIVGCKSEVNKTCVQAQRVRIQAAYQKQQDTFSKRASHLNKKIDSSRKKMDELCGGRSSSKADNRPEANHASAPESRAVSRSLSAHIDNSHAQQKVKLSNESINLPHNEGLNLPHT